MISEMKENLRRHLYNQLAFLGSFPDKWIFLTSRLISGVKKPYDKIGLDVRFDTKINKYIS